MPVVQLPASSERLTKSPACEGVSVSQSTLSSWVVLTGLLARQGLRGAMSRTSLGPFWSSIGTIVVIAAVGLLFGTILKQQLVSFETYVSTLAAGLILWGFLAAVANENAVAFARWMTVIRYCPVPLPVICLSILSRHLLVFGINLVVLLLAQWLLLGTIPNALALCAATLLTVITVAWIGGVAIVLGARFRDVGQLLSKVLQLAFLLTPILWPPYFLGRYDYLLTFNPLYYPLSVFTSAITGGLTTPGQWIGSMAMALSGSLLAVGLLCWSRHRLYFWI